MKSHLLEGEARGIAVKINATAQEWQGMMQEHHDAGASQGELEQIGRDCYTATRPLWQRMLTILDLAWDIESQLIFEFLEHGHIYLMIHEPCDCPSCVARRDADVDDTIPNPASSTIH